jgi:hypothetical protein
MPASGLATDCAVGNTIPVYYPSWLKITGTQDWVEVGTGFPCTTDWYWYEGYGDIHGFHWVGTQDKPALGDGHFFQIFRVSEYYHWQIGASEPVAPLFWNAVAYAAEAGIESYNQNVGTNYLIHDAMNVTLSESGWVAYSGVPMKYGDTQTMADRMCPNYLSETSFREKEMAPGTSC